MNNKAFVLAGRAVFTVTSKATGKRFTYRVKAPSVVTDAGGHKTDHDANVRFVEVLTGCDEQYNYLGQIWVDNLRYTRGKKSRIGVNAPSHLAFNYAWQAIVNDDLRKLDVQHEGHCARCGKSLTVPESIASGFGPSCRARLGL